MQNTLSKNRWLMLLTYTLCQCVCNFPSAWGVFQPYVATEYGYTGDAATLVMPLCVVFYGLMCIIGGRVQDTVSPRIASFIGSTMITIAFFNAFWIPAGNPLFMYVGFSCFFGGGCGFLFSSMFACTMKWYADKKGFAGGFTGCIAGLYIILLTYGAEYMLANLGARRSFLFIGIASAVIAFSISLFTVNPTREFMAEKSAAALERSAAGKSNQIEVVDFTTPEMLRTKQYYLLIFSIMLIMPSYMLINPALVTICMGKGLTKQAALSALAISSATTAVGRLVIPWISDFMGRKKATVLMWGCVAASAFLFMVVGGYGAIVAYSALAFFYSGGFAIIGPMATELFGFRYAGTNVGFVNVSNSAGSLIGPMLLAMFTPFLGDSASSIVGIGAAVLATLCMVLLNTNMKETKAKMDAKAEAEALV